MSRPLPFHYDWVIVATGALILFACLGLARYAYTMLLPGMSAGLGLSYDRMGFITGDFAGYFLSVLLAPVCCGTTPPPEHRCRPAVDQQLHAGAQPQSRQTKGPGESIFRALCLLREDVAEALTRRRPL